MLKRVEKGEEPSIKEYIGTNYDKCLYLYLDFVKYGLSNENLKFWLDIDNDEIKSVILKYYSGMHVFSKDKNCSYDDIVELILEETPSVICAEKLEYCQSISHVKTQWLKRQKRKILRKSPI